MLLKAQPSLLPRCIAAVPWVADMDATSPLAAICALGHVAHLCHTADVDPTMRAAIRKSSAKDQDRSREGADNRTDEALKATVDTLVSSLLPSGESHEVPTQFATFNHLFLCHPHSANVAINYFLSLCVHVQL